MINSTIFSIYDIRGRVPTDFTITDAYQIAHAILRYFQQKDPGLRAIVIGHDARVTSPAIAQQVQTAAADLGITVHNLDLCASPQLYHAVHTGPITSGIMITASHNPAEYNGFKIRLNKEPVWGDELQCIMSLIW